MKQKGFTLLELLVVISIIGLLASIVLVSLNSSRDKAKVARAQVEMKEIIKAIVIAQGEQGRPLLVFAPSSNCGQCSCGDMQSAGCQNQWNSALSEIQSATNGLVTGLTNFSRNPWGEPYLIDANQFEGGAGACQNVDGFWVSGYSVPNSGIPLSPQCP